MMDTLHVRLDHDAPFRPAFSAIYAEGLKFRSTPTYEYVADLRPHGHSALLHMACKHDKTGSHKLEIIDAGKMGMSELQNQIERVWDVDPLKLDIMRLDVCANIEGTPVAWFHDRARVLYKRWTAKIGEFSEMGNKQINSLYFGKRPNCFRIYDKIAELRARYVVERRNAVRPAACDRANGLRTELSFAPPELEDEAVAQFQRAYRELKEHIRDTECPSFEEWTAGKFSKALMPELHGVHDDAVVTRVERQMGGGRIPLKIGNMARLKQNLPDVNPFEKLTLEVAHLPGELDAGRYMARRGARFDTWCMGVVVADLVKKYGARWARGYVEMLVGRNNVGRTWKRIEEFLPSETGGVTTSELFERYRQSVTRQLAA